MTRTVPPCGENERALSIRLLITWPSRESLPSTEKPPSPSNCTVTTVPSSRGTSLATLTTVLISLRQIDRRGVLALHLRIEPAGVRDIGDEAVEPLHVVLDDLEQARAARLGSWRAAASRPPSAARSAGS